MVVISDEELKKELEEVRNQRLFELAMNKKNIATEPSEKRESRGEPPKIYKD